MKKILVIEDDKDVKAAIEKAFEGTYEHLKFDDSIIQACKEKNGLSPLKKALKRILNQNHKELRAIICDLGLLQRGEENNYQAGCDIIEWIRTGSKDIGLPKEYLSSIPIVVYTAASDNTNHRVALKAGADDVITKQNPTQLFGLIDRVQPRVERFDKNYYTFQFYKKKIGISYTWKNEECEHHFFVKEIAKLLSSHYLKERILFDEFEQETGKSPGKNREKFSQKYEKECEYILVCISNDYNDGGEKSWTKVEWKIIKEIYKNSPERIMLLPIEKMDFNKAFTDILEINETDLEVIMQPDAHHLLEKYNQIRQGCGAAHKDAWMKLLEDRSVKDYIRLCFEEKDRIIKDIEKDIIKPIIDRIDSTDLN